MAKPVLPSRKYPPGRIQRGLTAWWPLDSATCEFGSGQIRPLDIIGNNYGYDALSKGSVAGPPWGDGSSAYYNGDGTSATYCVLNADPLQGKTGTNVNVTLAAWAYYRNFLAPGGTPRLFQFTNQISVILDDGAQGAAGSGGVIFENSSLSNARWTTVTGIIPFNKWVHIALTISAGVCTGIYVNGVSIATTTGFLGFSTSGGYSLGCRDFANRNMDGMLADAMVFNGTVLNANEIAELYKSYFIPVEELPALFTPPVDTRVAGQGRGIAKRAILRAYERGLDLPGQQPRGKMQIDWSHPVSRGLSYLRVLGDRNAAAYIDNGFEGAQTTLSGAPAYQAGPAGVGLCGVGAIAHASAQYNMPQTTGTFVGYVTAGWTPADSQQHVLFFLDEFGIQQYLDNNWYCGWFPGSEQRVAVSASGTFNAGDTFSLALTYDTAVGSALWTKGVQRGTRSGCVTASTVPSSIQIGGSSGGGGDTWNRSSKDAIYYVAIWSRVLSDDEIRALDAEPYCFFTSAETELPALFVSGTPGAGTGSAAGVGIATAIGSATVSSQGAAAGAGLAAAVGTGIQSAQGAAAGAGTANGISGAITSSAVGAAAGAGTATAIGTGIKPAQGAAAGTGLASAVGAAVISAVGASSGAGIATGIAGGTFFGTAAGTGSAQAVGKSLATAQGAAAGIGSAQGVGSSQAIVTALGAASGIGTAQATPFVPLSSAQGAASGFGMATAIGRALVTPPVAPVPYPSKHDYGWYDRRPPVRGRGR